MIPWFDGAILSREWKEALWDKFVSAEILAGPLRIDAADHSATMDGRPLHLTRREFDLLWMLASHHGRLVTQEMILRSIWGPAHTEDVQYLCVYVRQLRQKLGDDAANPRYIATEPGIGYRFLPTTG